MANRYWVGGTGTWDTTSTTNWSATSGGSGGASVPSINDSIFFDQAGPYNVTLTGAIQCLDWTVSVGTVTFITGTFPSLVVNGNVSWIAGTVAFSGATFGFQFGSAGTKTISTNGVSIPGNPTTFSTGTFNFASAFTTSLNITTIFNPIINTNGYAFTFGQIGGNGTYNWGSSTVTSTGANVISSGAPIINPGSSTLICTSSNNPATLNAGTTGLTFNNVIFTSTPGVAIGTQTNTFNNLTVYSASAGSTTSVTFGANQTINGTLSTVNTAGNRRIFFASATYGLAYTLNINTSSANLIDADFRDLYIKGGAAPLNGIRIGNRGNCRGISFSTPKTCYWNLAGAQNWSANGWATTPTGTPSTDNFPLPQDTAIFTNAGSVTGTITLDAAIGYVPTVDMSARTSAMTMAFNSTTTCYGNWTNGSGTTLSGTLALTFSGGGTQTITSAGKTFTCPITIDTYGGTVQLADALTLGAGGLQLGINNGTFDTLDKNVTAGTISSSNSNVRTIKLRSSTVTNINGGAAYSLTDTRNLTFDAGTSTILFTGVLHTLASGGLTFYNVSFTSGSSTTHTIQGVNTFNNLSVTPPSFDGIKYIVFSANQIINGTLTCAGASAVRRIFLNSSTNGTQSTLTVNSLSATDCDFRDIVIAGTSAGASPTRAGNCGGNSGITFPAPKTVYWNLAGSQNWSAIGWCTGSGGTPDINQFPLAQDTAVIDNTGSITTLGLNAAWNIGTFDASLRTSVMTFIVSLSPFVYGDWKFGTGITSSSTTTPMTFAKNGTQTITSNGIQFGCPITINHPSAVVQLADAISLTATNTLTLILGTFDAVSYNVTTGLFLNSSSTNILKMGSGTWTLSGTGTLWNLSSAPTVISGTSTIVLSNTSTTARTFTTGSAYYNKLTIGGSTGISTLTISGTGNFGELASTKTVAHTILFQSTFIQTIGKWSVTGTAGNVVTLGPTTAASAYILSIAGPANTGIDYLSVSYCDVSTTSPGEFYVGANSTNTAGNTGAIVFTATPAARTLYWVGGTGNWSATTSWSTSSGGSSGAAIPTSLDSVNFNSASNATAYTATIDTGITIARCAAFNMAGPTSGNITFAGTISIAFHGNVTFAATGITRSYTGTMYLTGNSSYTFTTNGLSLTNILYVFGINSTWTLGSALTSSNSLIVTYGNFNTSASNYALNITQLSSSNINVRGISLNGSTVTVAAAGGVVVLTTITNLTFNAGTSLFNITGNSLSFASGGLTFYNVTITAGSSTAGAIQGANIFNNLTITAQTNVTAWPLTFNANQTINGTLTLNAGTAAAYRTLLASDTIGTQRTLTCAAISSVTDIDFRDINFAGVITLPVTGTRLGDCKGNSNITFDAGKTVYYGRTASNSWGVSISGSWSATSGGALDATQFPLAQDTAVFPAATYPASGSNITINATYNIGTIDMSLRTTNTMTLTVSSAPNVYGNWITGTGITFSGTVAVTFAGRTSQTVTNAGKIWSMPTIINSPGGSVTLQDSWATSAISSSPVPMSFIAGTFDANGYNVTFASTVNGNAGFSTSGALAKTLAMGSGTWTFGCTGTTWVNTATNITVTGTGTINLTNSSAKSFEGSGYYSGITLNQGGAGALTISGSNTFKDITNSYNATGATSIDLGTTIQTLSQFTATGAAGKLLTITGTAASTPATLVYTGSRSIPTIDYVVPTFIKAYPLTSTWSVGTNSTNGGSLGFIFPDIQPLGSFMTFF